MNTLENCLRTARIWLKVEYVTNYFVYFSCLAQLLFKKAFPREKV